MSVDPQPVPLQTHEVCEITVWRGYAKSRFYARLADASEDEAFVAVAESPTFRFRGNGAPEPTDEAADAHRKLVAALVARGWQPAETGGPWYASRFTRPLAYSDEG